MKINNKKKKKKKKKNEDYFCTLFAISKQKHDKFTKTVLFPLLNCIQQ
jgi:hypothetical protein